MIPRNRSKKDIVPTTQSAMSPMEIAEVIELDIHFVDGTIYTPTLTKHDEIRNFPDSIVLTFDNDAKEQVVINRRNVTFVSVRHVTRPVPARAYTPIDQRDKNEKPFVTFDDDEGGV